MAEIKQVTIRHMAIMDYLMANPTVALGEVARHFGITQPWLSSVIHSDAFQAILKDKHEVAFHHTVLPLREKITHVAHQALDKLAQQLPLETDLRTINNVAENVLDRLGFGTKGAVVINNTNVQNTQINTLASELEEARALLGKAERPKIGVTIDASGKIPTLALPHESAPNLGETNFSAALFTGDSEVAFSEERIET